MKRLSERDDGGEIEVRVGESVELTLPETSGTGFRWDFASRAQPILKLEADDYAHTAAGPGGNRMRRLRFTAVAAGEATLQLNYARPWQKGAATRSFKLKLRAVAP